MHDTEAPVLVNGSDCFPNLERLKEDFDIIYLLDLCAGIEAAVVHEELVLTTLGEGNEEILGPLAQEGILFRTAVRSADPIASAAMLIELPRAAELMRRVESVGRFDEEDQDLAITATVAAMSLPTDLYIEEDKGGTLVLPFRQAAIYLSLPSLEGTRSALHQAKLSLAERYAPLKDALVSFRLSEAVDEVDSVPIPPIALKLLSRAHTFDELGEMVLDERRRFAPMRRRFAEIREIYASSSGTLRDRYLKKARMTIDMERALKDARRVPSSIEFVGDAEKIGEALAPFLHSGDPTKFAKLASPIARWIEDGLYRMRMRPLIGLVDLYLDITAEDLRKCASVLFDHELTERDIKRARGYGAAVEKYVPRPVPSSTT